MLQSDSLQPHSPQPDPLQPESLQPDPVQADSKEAAPVTAPAKINFVWRFYVDPDGAWRWQRLGTDSKIHGESPASHATYEVCVADAEVYGYHFARSQEKVGQLTRTFAHLRGW
jgi:hypothetical protein